ncbi:MAG: hypothetical protein MMC33_007477 [Icmadophila ericetorum]|nr:hypothetical protein [Icmadophila ericetorum]
MSSNPPTGHFTILYFAFAATFTKKSSEYLPAPLEGPKLLEKLEKMYPGIKARVLDTSAITVNLDYVDLEGHAEEDEKHLISTLVIKEGDEVAIIPPVSSG